MESCTPMWTFESSEYLNNSSQPIDLKAFVLFYIYVLWPDSVRESFKIDIELNTNGQVNSFLMPWNLPVSNYNNYVKWFPKSIFPNGPGFNEDSMMLSLYLRCCLDNLVVACFCQHDVDLKKTAEYGLGFYSRYNDLKLKEQCFKIKG